VIFEANGLVCVSNPFSRFPSCAAFPPIGAKKQTKGILKTNLLKLILNFVFDIEF